MDILTDYEYLEQFKNGNEVAVEFLINKYKTMVNSIARRYFLIGAEQEDLIQEGMIGLYKACLTYKQSQTTSFSSYAFLLIKHQIQNAIKVANRQKNLVLSGALELNSQGFVVLNGNDSDEHKAVFYIPKYEESPENKMIEKEKYDELVSKMKESLSKYEFNVLQLYLEGFKNEQISLLTHKDLKSTENAISRVKSKLRFLN